MKQMYLFAAIMALVGCGGASGKGSSETTAEHHDKQGCEHCKHKGHDGQGCEHCKQKGGHGDMHGGGEHGGMHHGGGHEGMHHGGGHEGMHHGEGPHAGHDGPLVHRFEKADDWAKEFDNPERDAWQKPAEVVQAMGLSPGMIVADIGAGTGYFLPHLSKAVGPSGKVLGLDIEADMVRYMSERAAKEKLGNVEAKLAAMGDPGLAAGSVDRILIVDTWHHIPERGAYAQKLRTALRPGGLLIVVDFTLEATKGPPKEHRLAADKVIAELETAGFSGKAIDESLPEQYIVVAKAK